MFSFYKQGSELNTAYPILDGPMNSSLGYNTNNVYKNFPPLMSDGRSLVASWQPENIVNDDLIKTSGIYSNLDYRRYLQHMSKEIMTYNFTEACNDVGYYKRYAESPISSEFHSRPYLFQSYMENKEVMGVENTDLRKNYLSREQLNSKKITPFLSYNDEANIRDSLKHKLLANV